VYINDHSYLIINHLLWIHV